MIPSFLAVSYLLLLLWGEFSPKVAPQLVRHRRWLINVFSGALAMMISYIIWGYIASKSGLWQPSQSGALFEVQKVMGWILLLLAYDLALYGWHRLNHVNRFLWRYHRFHHLDSELDTTSALRFHWMEFLLTGVWRLPFLWILSPSLTTWTIVAAIATLAAGFHHSRAWLPERIDKIVSKVFVTPRWHWAHHHPERKFHDAQYGVIFSFWDRIFASVSIPPDLAMGLENESAESGLKWKHLGI